MSSDDRTSELPYSALVKRFILLYLMGIVLALEFATLLETLVYIQLWWRLKVLVIILVAPSVLAFAGIGRWPPTTSRLPVATWVTNAVVLFVFWSGGYMLVGALVSHGPFESLQTRFDNSFPFMPEWVFIYLSVYFVFVLPFFYVDNARRLLTFTVAQMSALCVCYVLFIVYPVAAPRPSVEPGAISNTILSIVHGSDPAWNCFPSTHCTTCTIASLVLLRGHRLLGIWVAATTVGVCLSTLFTQQHFVLDVVAGVVLGAGIYGLVMYVLEYSPLRHRVARLTRYLEGRT